MPLGCWAIENLYPCPLELNMKITRRNVLQLAAGALPAMPRVARAQTYPTRLVRLVIGFPAGGAGDILARLIGQRLQERLGQPFVIENRPGAASNVAAEAVAKAPADGYTLYWTTSANAISVALYEKLNYDFVRDFAPVAGVMRGPLIMEVTPSLPVNTVSDLVAYAKANPGKLNMASAGNGSTSHLAGELFKMMTDISMVHVPYRGSAPALTDRIGGQIQVMFDNITSSIEHIRAGKLRALAVTTATRSPSLPNLPAIDEYIRGYEASGWFGISAPKSTPVDIINNLNREIDAGLVETKLAVRFADLGGVALTGSASDFGKLVADETEKWAKVVKFAGIRAD
jgi:tripartite-type tricarboxylate transporter receptor subunit TctC